jgi:hypothetical protein
MVPFSGYLFLVSGQTGGNFRHFLEKIRLLFDFWVKAADFRFWVKAADFRC